MLAVFGSLDNINAERLAAGLAGDPVQFNAPLRGFYLFYDYGRGGT